MAFVCMSKPCPHCALAAKNKKIADLEKELAKLKQAPNNIPCMVWSSSTSAGSCDFCNAHVTPTGGIQHNVLCVSNDNGGGMKVRFCEVCLAALVHFAKSEPVVVKL